jgi:hypothetical protein
MRGKKAKAIRNKVYGEGGYSGPKGREYEIGPRKHAHLSTSQVIATGKRREYQDAKKA